MNLDELLEKHVVIAGMTDKGKTTFAKYLFHEVKDRRVIFVNTQAEWMGIDPIHVWNPQLLKGKSQKMNLVPNVDRDVATKELEDMVQDLMFIGKRVNPKRAEKAWCIVMVDEAAEYSPKMGRTHDPLKTLAKRGKRYGVTLVSITQRPADLSHTVLTQAGTHFYFDLSNYEKGYFEKYAVPYDRFADHVARPFHFTMIQGGEVTDYDPIPEEYST